MAFISSNQLALSTRRLNRLHPFFGFAFLGFKKARLPVGSTVPFSYTEIHNTILVPFFRLLPDVERFFSPFASSNPKQRWLSPRYASTALQRIINDTFSEAFIHTKGSSLRGWVPAYVEVLRQLQRTTKSSRIPVLDLSVWLYRDQPFSTSRPITMQLANRFKEEFHITTDEMSRLCSGVDVEREIELASEPFDTSKFLNLFGWPDNQRPSTGISVHRVQLQSVGPTNSIDYRPTERLNLIVGDNSLGKTFLLDCLWWGMTDNWSEYPAEPKDRNFIQSSEILATLRDRSGYQESFLALYDASTQRWQRKAPALEGLGLYARHDGSFSLWDPLKGLSAQWRGLSPSLLFDRKAVWTGLSLRDETGRDRHICNGLIHDLVTWQTTGAFKLQQRLFKDIFNALSAGTEVNGVGDATTIPEDARLMPTIRMPYGDVPVVYVSAGVRRVLSLAYLLVWAWTEHLQSASQLNRKPYSQMVLLLDELEAHLHPKWQRTILPAILKVLGEFGSGVLPQIHVATHSPLILASAEPGSDESRDAVHLLELAKDSATLTSRPFQKRGTVDAWLTSEFFDLSAPRSKEAEDAIEAAKLLQASRTRVAKSDVEQAHQRLLRVLPDDDQFWIRWNYFRQPRQ